MEWSWEIVLGVSLVSLISIYLYSKTGSHKKAPPSLPWLPFVGSLPFLSDVNTLHICLTEKAKRYGNIYSISCGQRYAVVLNGHDAIQEALLTKGQDFAGRERVFIEQHVMNPEFKGVAFRQYDQDFKFIRKTTVAIMKNLGYGEHATMERKIHEEIQEFVKYIRSKEGKSFDIERIIHLSILNVIHNLMYGKRFHENDPTGEFISKGLFTYMNSFHPTLDLFPIVRFLPKFKKIIQDTTALCREWKLFFKGSIEECLSSSSEGENFFKQFVNLTGDTFDSTEPYYIMKDFLLGGTDTSAATLLWSLILLANHPATQKRLRDDIDAVVPRDRLPSLSDSLPYLEAVILEIMHIKTVVPLALPHVTLRDTGLAGYFIPADTQVLVNLYSAHMDPNVFPEPEVLRPERFLNENGDVINKDLMITFGLGKRRCPGELLARQEVFLFLATLVQQFDIQPPEGMTSISDKGTASRLNNPDTFLVRLVPIVA